MDFLNKAKNFINSGIGKVATSIGNLVAPGLSQTVKAGVNMAPNINSLVQSGNAPLNQTPPPVVATPPVAPAPTMPTPVNNPTTPINVAPSTSSYTAPEPFKIDTSNVTSSNLGQTTTPNDVLAYRKSLEDKYNAYVQAQAPLQNQYATQSGTSPEYQQAQEQLLGVNAGYRQGVQDIMNKPIGMDFQTGQTAALTRDASLKQQAAVDVANYYENLRKNNLAQTTAQLGFNTDQFNNQMAIDKSVQDYAQNYASQNKPFAVSEGSSVYNPMTGQIEVTNPKSDALTAGQINTTVNSIAGAFDNEPIVKNYNVIAEGYNFAKSLAGNANPTSADDQGLVYAFAKAMDPNSAVKEGEYVTVQKYNQSLVQKGWANAKRIVDNVAFLTPEARNNMVKTIESKYKASQQEYDNVTKEYQRQIDDAYAGKPRQITNYSAGVNSGSSTNSFAEQW